MESLAARIRFPTSAVESKISVTRAWFRKRRVDRFRWLIGPSSRPAEIAGLLLASGAARDADEPTLTAMVLDIEPPAVAGIRVRRVKSLTDFEAMEAIHQAVYPSPTQGGADVRDRRARWAEFRATAGRTAFLAEVDADAVAYGVMVRTEPGPMLLAGGVTLPEARGQGAYRALIRARWMAARRSGAPALVTQAQAASRPILDRLGFRAGATIEVFVDQP